MFKANFYFLYVLCVVTLTVSAQKQTVELLHANSLQYDERKSGKVRKLFGDVQFKQQNTMLYCDSAFQYESDNKVEAFGNVRINHNDSLTFTGNKLTYYGNSRQAILEDNVTMKDGITMLTTNRLDFDMNTNKGYYSKGGRITSDENSLTSKIGYYYANEKLMFFKKDVVLVSTKYKVLTDSLRYNTQTRMAYYSGPTNMYSENDTLYCEKGTYDTNKEISQLYNNALISNVDMVLNADTIYYLKPTNYGKARGTVKILDRKNETKLYGSFAEMIGSRGQFTITKDAVVKKYMDRDSMYIVCDTIQYFKETDIQEEMVRCYHKVNIFKSDLQAICDSLVYIKNDSIIYLYTQPVVWSGVNQITSDTILLFINNNMLDSFKLRSNGFLISREGSKEFNQLVGRNMYGSFKDSKISYMFASGNAQSIYYAKDDDSAYMGVNVITCSEMEFMFADNKISRANFITKPDAIFHPLNVLKSEELRLKGFKWKERIRPKQNKILPLLRVKYSDL